MTKIVKFYGEKLKDVRLLFGMSRKELSEKSNIIEQDLWKMETGYLSPTFEQMNALKIIFHVKPRFFQTPPTVKKVVDTGNISLH